MPELPEVYTFIQSIKDDVINKEIKAVVVNREKNIKNATKEYFISFFLNEEFTKIAQRGKFLIFYLTNNKSMVMHLRMEGKVIYQDHNDEMLNNHNLITWIFDVGELRYYDTRQFGTFYIYQNEDPLLVDPGLKKEGYEPFGDDFTVRNIKEAFLKHKKTPLKTLLLDQSVIAGIGNIYADEILFACHLNPLSTSVYLNDEDYENIVRETKLILQDAIDHKGTTVHTFGFGKNLQRGDYENYLKVHLRQNKPCFNCKNKIKKIKVNGRGTYFCDHCQKLPKRLQEKYLAKTNKN